jgi:hypothetical protein
MQQGKETCDFGFEKTEKRLGKSRNTATVLVTERRKYFLASEVEKIDY